MINVKPREPMPGDLIQAMNDMRSWETDEVRGTSGEWVFKCDQVLLVQVWDVGRQRRYRVLCKNRLLLFSSTLVGAALNWKIIGSNAFET